MKHILIVEKHPVMGVGTCKMIEKFISPVQLSLVDTFWKAIDVASSKDFDLVLMDIAIPGGNSVQMVKKFRGCFPHTLLLIFSGYQEELFALPYVKAGAQGFLSKTASEQEFQLAVETVLLCNNIYLSNSVRELPIRGYIQSRNPKIHPVLTEREQLILRLFYDRKRASQIAAELNISTSTVNTYRVRLFTKLGVNNMIDLVGQYEHFFLHL